MYYPASFVQIPTTVLSLPGASEKATSLRWDCTNCNELSNQVLCSLGIVKPGTVFTIVKPGIVLTRYCQTRYCVHSVLFCFVFKPGTVFTRYCQTRFVLPSYYQTNCQTRYCVHSVLSNQVLCSLLSNQVLCSLGIVKPVTVFTLFCFVFKPGTVFTRYCQTGFVLPSYYQTRYCVHSVLSNQISFSLGIVKPGIVFTPVLSNQVHSVLSV